MASDLSTVGEVDAGEYTVRVGKDPKGGHYEAVVVEESQSNTRVTPAMLFAGRAGSEDGDTEPVGPTVSAPHRWVAIGLAIEAHEWGEVGEEPDDAETVYNNIGVMEDSVDITDLELEYNPGNGVDWDG